MDVTISTRRTELTPRLEDYVRDKVGRLDRFVEGLDRAEVHLFEETNPRITDKETCEVTLEGHGHHVRAKVSAPDGFAATDAAVAKLEKQLRKLKTRMIKRWHHSGDAALLEFVNTTPETAAEEVATFEPRIVKSKKFHIASMTPEEAVLELELVNHDFYFFHNSETERAAIVYRREDDGTFGLIDEAG